MKNLIFLVLTVGALSSCIASQKGNWSKSDTKKARKELSKVEAEVRTSLGDQTDAYFDCYLEKIINTYKNYEQANEDYQGCEKLALECVESIVGGF